MTSKEAQIQKFALKLLRKSFWVKFWNPGHMQEFLFHLMHMLQPKPLIIFGNLSKVTYKRVAYAKKFKPKPEFSELLKKTKNDHKNNYKICLTHYSPVLFFHTPWKHQKTVGFPDVFTGYRKATPGYNGLKLTIKIRAFMDLNKFI